MFLAPFVFVGVAPHHETRPRLGTFRDGHHTAHESALPTIHKNLLRSFALSQNMLGNNPGYCGSIAVIIISRKSHQSHMPCDTGKLPRFIRWPHQAQTVFILHSKSFFQLDELA